MEMKTFNRFIENKMYVEVGPPPMAGVAPSPGGIGGPGALPGGPPPGGIGMPPPGGGMPMGGLGGGMPPMPPTPGAPGQPSTPNKLKSYNVWDVLERVLGKSEPK